MYSKMKTNESMNKYFKLKQVINDCDVIIVGAGSGLSTAAGLYYSGPIFEDNFSDFIDKYHFTDMYTAGNGMNLRDSYLLGSCLFIYLFCLVLLLIVKM